MNETNVTIYSILRTIRTYNTCVIFFVKMHCDSRKKKKEKKKRIKRSLLYYAIATHLYARFMRHK